MAESLLYLVGSTLAPSIVAFGATLWRQRAQLPVALGFARLSAVFVAVAATCFLTFCALLVVTAVTDKSRIAALQGSYLILAAIAGYLAGTNMLSRLSRTRGA